MKKYLIVFAFAPLMIACNQDKLDALEQENADLKNKSAEFKSGWDAAVNEISSYMSIHCRQRIIQQTHRATITHQHRVQHTRHAVNTSQSTSTSTSTSITTSTHTSPDALLLTTRQCDAALTDFRLITQRKQGQIGPQCTRLQHPPLS